MAKSKGSRIDLQNLSRKDIDVMTLGMDKLVKKYEMNKASVYTRRNSINKRLKAEGFTLDQIINGNRNPAEIKRSKTKPKKPVEVKSEENPIRDVAVIEKNIPVVMKPIEINFENFSLKLNGVPKRISVNPETHAIEIDL